MASQRREALAEYVRGALWVMPALWVAVVLAIGGILSKVTISRHSFLHPLVFQGTPDDARNVLVAIASTMVTVIALVLGLMVVALTLSSTQYSPRLLRNFLRDGANKAVLSAFVATFAYSAAGLYTVGVSNGDRTNSYPHLAVSFAIVLLFVSLGALVYQVHHISHSMQVDAIMRQVEDATQGVLRRVTVTPCPGEPPSVPATATAIRASRSGYVQTIHPEPLIEAGSVHRVNVAIMHRVGEHVVAGYPIAWVWFADGGAVEPVAVEAAVRESIRLGFERTLEQDAAFGIRQLVDMASKALSPAVNDPYTAVQATNHLAVIMGSIARREHGIAVCPTAAGTTVTVPGYSFGDYLELACAQIRRYGAAEPAVALALIAMLDSTAHVTQRADRKDAMLAQLDLVLADASREIKQPSDLEPVHAAATQLRRRLS